MKVTNEIKNDGFGSQYQNIIWSIIYCELKGYDFYYSPLVFVEHNYDHDPFFIDKLENLMNIKNNFKNMNNNDDIITLDSNEVYNYIQSHFDKLENSNILKIIKNNFLKNKKKIFTNSCLNIAVHVRRPNHNDNRIEGTQTSDEYYLNIMNNIRKTYQNIDLCFHIYSQGKLDSFEKYKDNDVVLHINECVMKTFQSLVEADMLVSSASSFSYIASMLSNGTIYHHKFWHPPFSYWL